MRQVKDIPLVLIAIFSLLSCSRAKKEDKNNQSKTATERKYDGYVPDEMTARKIAEAILLPIYGDEVLNEKPYKVRLVGDSLWIVEGTLNQSMLGGVAYIEIRKSDCKIVKVTHGK
jgi:NTF2 fold immunity protein